jgi:hypothetical protein
MSCDHHSHRLKWRFRCCRCSAEYVIGRGWVEGSGKPLKATECSELRA